MVSKSKVADGIQNAMAEAQAKAKEAMDKGASLFGEYGEFAKGNVEAVISSSRILAEGLQEMGKTLVTESQETMEKVTAEMQELAAAKSPTEFLRIQSDIVRRNFDTAVSYGSKNSEAMLKLATEVMAPISGRFNVAFEKVRKSDS